MLLGLLRRTVASPLARFAVAGGAAALASATAVADNQPQIAKKRIAVYGGSFNPITNAHLNCAAEIIHSRLADEVWVVPCGPRPDKPSMKTSGLHRLIMCHLAVDTTFGSKFGVRVLDECINFPQDMPSLVLMRRLQARYPRYEFTFVVGSDNVPSLHEWDAKGCDGCWDEIEDAGTKLVTEQNFLVISRPGTDVDLDTLPPNFQVIGAALQSRDFRQAETLLSSSEVRHRISGAGRSRVRAPDDVVRYELRRGAKAEPTRRAWYDDAEGLVPPSVLGHIVRYGLYARDDDPDPALAPKQA